MVLYGGGGPYIGMLGKQRKTKIYHCPAHLNFHPFPVIS